MCLSGARYSVGNDASHGFDDHEFNLSLCYFIESFLASGSDVARSTIVFCQGLPLLTVPYSYYKLRIQLNMNLICKSHAHLSGENLDA